MIQKGRYNQLASQQELARAYGANGQVRDTVSMYHGVRNLYDDYVFATILRVIEELKDKNNATKRIIDKLRSNNKQLKTDSNRLQKEKYVSGHLPET